jgi:biopolymer transport protein TolR
LPVSFISCASKRVDNLGAYRIPSETGFLIPSGYVGEYRGTPVDLPHVGHPVSMAHADREDAILIAVTRDDKIFFRADKVSLDQLPAKIRESLNQGSEKKVYIRADARAKYVWVAEVLDNVRSTGVERIGFLVDQRRPPAPNPQ